MTRALLVGCGHDKRQRMRLDGRPDWSEVVTLDSNPDVAPDVLHDLRHLPLPFAADSFDEIHAYDVLEHTRAQGDEPGFFAEWREFWSLLRPGGLFFGMVPRWDGVWAWGDPGHRRVISGASLSFLSQAAYIEECRPGGTNRTDYRRLWTGDFDVLWADNMNDVQFGFVLRAVKPSRWSRA